MGPQNAEKDTEEVIDLTAMEPPLDDSKPKERVTPEIYDCDDGVVPFEAEDYR